MHLLLAHGDDGGPMLDREADPRAAAAVAAPVAPREPRFLADITADANDLERQGWAVVSAADAGGARLEALVRGLVGARAEEQRAPVLSIRVPPSLDAEQALAWKRTAYPAMYGDDEARRPRYLLILGDLDQVSLATQQVLAQDGLVGRLACATDDGYGAYADKVLAWQRTPSPAERARALFYTVHDGTRATAEGHAKLILPCQERCERMARDKPRAFPAAIEAHGAPSPEPDELRRLAAAPTPSVLLSMSHGLGPPRRRRWSPAEAREHQGEMSFGIEGALTAQDLQSQPFLPGGIWIYFACFGAGTPRLSAYHHWLQMLQDHGMDLGPAAATLRGLDDRGGFVSGLGKAALAHPGGPLAILGHIDLAWSYSYEELHVGGHGDARRISGSNRSLNFFQAMSKLVAGERAGAAALALKLQLDAVGAALTSRYDRCKREGSVEGATPDDRLALGNLWMLHQDLLGYALLGDPAVRLAVGPREAPGGARQSPAEADDRAHGANQEANQAANQAADQAADQAAIDRLEQAALAVASGESAGVVAARLGIARSELVDAAAVYRDAGRAALAALLSSRGPDR